MNDDYLWDKSGQPDPEIQQLEEILGTLRYQPRPLEIPGDLRGAKRRSYFPLLAIAATVLVALLAGLVWLRVRTNNLPQQHQAQKPTVSPTEQKEIPPNKDEVIVNAPESSRNDIAVNKPRNRTSLTPLRKRERQEGLAAKEQVMLALRLASEKLNLAHRKTQTSPANQIKNQHRIG